MNSFRNHYMLGKCYWKMFSYEDLTKEDDHRIFIDKILDTLANAISALPRKRDSRSEPILEPHYKFVSVVHKLVHRGVLSVSALGPSI